MLGFDRVADRRKDVDRVLVSACYVKPPRFSRIRQRSRGAVELRLSSVASGSRAVMEFLGVASMPLDRREQGATGGRPFHLYLTYT